MLRQAYIIFSTLDGVVLVLVLDLENPGSFKIPAQPRNCPGDVGQSLFFEPDLHRRVVVRTKEVTEPLAQSRDSTNDVFLKKQNQKFCTSKFDRQHTRDMVSVGGICKQKW